MGPPAIGLPLIAILASCVLIVWRVYARVRRFISRQRFRPLRCWVAVVFYVVLVIALLIWIVQSSWPVGGVAELLGVGIGIGLAVYGLRVTKFESTPSGLYYTPNVHIGIALSLLLIARVAYRLVELYFSTGGFAEPPTGVVRSPLTLLIVGTLAGYYAWYAFGLLLWYRSHQTQEAQLSQGRGDA
jgi:hypothetical protein